MPVFIDQTGREIELAAAPKRIISLVPSQTELLYDLGLAGEIVGITKFCVHPDSWFRSKTRVGGTKQIKTDIIHQLQPDLIIANKEENVKEQVEEFAKKFPVWISDVRDLETAYEMITKVGSLTGKERAAEKILVTIRENFSQYDTRYPTPPVKQQAIYLIWQKPYMTVGGDTFINTMLQRAGFDNLFADRERYPEITIEALQQAKPAFLFLSSEPFPFKLAHAEELGALLPSTQVLLVDGELFSWYGSRLQHAPAYFARLRQQLQ